MKEVLEYLKNLKEDIEAALADPNESSVNVDEKDFKSVSEAIDFINQMEEKSTSSNTSDVLTSLYETANMMNASESHVKAEGVFGDKSATAVYSIFIGQRPSNDILSDLEDWAEDNDRSDVLDKIAQLTNQVL